MLLAVHIINFNNTQNNYEKLLHVRINAKTCSSYFMENFEEKKMTSYKTLYQQCKMYHGSCMSQYPNSEKEY